MPGTCSALCVCVPRLCQPWLRCRWRPQNSSVKRPEAEAVDAFRLRLERQTSGQSARSTPALKGPLALPET
jgi:hypothetical protein